MLVGTAMIFAVACTSTEKRTTPMSGSTVSPAKTDAAGDMNPSAREAKPKAVAPQVQAKPPSSSSPRGGRDTASSSSTGGQAHDASAVSEQREARITPLDQSDAANDIETTRRIRQAVMQDDSLSFRAKNVTIVTNGDRVVLTGRVNTRGEADRIKEIARSVTPHHIEDRLEIHQ
jgi:osmotically-inducible protein OsmY